MPPGPKRSYPGSLLLQFRRDPLGPLQKIAREHGDILYLRLGRENVYRPAGPAVCKTRQARPRRSMAPSRGNPVRTPIASPKPLPGPATGAPRVPDKGSPVRGIIPCGTRQTPPERPDRGEGPESFPQ
jgi:hypothetical protein